MNLLEIRTQYVKLTGRYDLITDATSWADNGADFFIQSGQNLIERLVGDLPESEGRLWETIASGVYYVGFQKRCRMIFDVWANNGDNRIQLERKSWKDLKDSYTSNIANTDTGCPVYYCPAKLREIDAIDQNATGEFFNYTLANSKDFRGIVIMPPVDGNYDIEIYGKFLQTALTADDDENFWTLVYPEILIRAAVYQTELTYRGRGAVSKLYESLLLELVEIDKDSIEESSHEFNTIKR